MTDLLFPFVWMFLVFFKGFDGNSSLRFSFDLTLPGKRASRKGPSTKKVWLTILVYLKITQSALRLLVADSFRNFIPVLVDRGHARLLWEPQLSVLQPRGSWEHRPAQAVSIYAISWQKKYVHESWIPSQPPLFVYLSPVSFPFCPHIFLPLFPLLFPMHPSLLQPRNEGADWDGENLCGWAAVCFAGNVLTEWPWNNWSVFCFPSSHLPRSGNIVDDLWMHSFWNHIFPFTLYSVAVSQSLIM